MLAAGGAESLKGRARHLPPPVAEETSRCALQGLLTGDRILRFFSSERRGWNRGAIDSLGLQGGRGWLAFVHRSRIPQSFRRARICKFSRQKHRFFFKRENRPFVVVKRLTHTHARSLKHPF